MTRYAAAALVQPDGRMLLGLRSAHRTFYPGVWDFIGGHCGDGEPFEAAMLREVGEEIGVVPATYSLAYTAFAEDAELRIFLVTEWTGVVVNRAPEEHECVAWFSLEEAKSLPLPDVGYTALLDALAEDIQRR